MFSSKLFSCKIREITPQHKINNLKNSIDPNIIKPEEEKEKISFKEIKKEEKHKAKKQELEKKENKKVKIPGQRLIETIKKDRKDLILKPEQIKIDGTGRNEKLIEKREKLQKLKDMLKELKENS
jgi:hypothetical protein